MLETLKKKSKKSHIITVVVCAAIAIVLMAITKFAILDVITGPQKLDLTADPATQEGRYVTMDAQFVLADFVEHTTTTQKKYSSTKTTRVDGYSYLAFEPVVNYEEDTAVWYFYGIYMKKADQDRMNQIMDASWACLEDSTQSTPPPEPVTVKGTWTVMEPSVERYCRETLAELGVTEGDYDVVRFYTLDGNKLGGQDKLFFWVLNGIAGACLLFAIWNIVGIFGNGYMEDINSYLRKNSSISLMEIENDFKNAQTVGKDMWIGKKWTIYMAGANARLISNRDLVWGYYYYRSGRHGTSELRLFDINKKNYFIGMSEERATEALEIYGENQPHIVPGYSKELEKLYNKNFDEFLNLKYRPAIQAIYDRISGQAEADASQDATQENPQDAAQGADGE